MNYHRPSLYSYLRRMLPSDLRMPVWRDKAGRKHVVHVGRPHCHPAQRPGYRRPSEQQLRRARQDYRTRHGIDIARVKPVYGPLAKASTTRSVQLEGAR